MHDPLSYATAFMLGLLGSGHCIAMCGGIMGALSMAIPGARRAPSMVIPMLLAYNAGRILSYGIAGALIGGVGWLLQDAVPPAGTALRILAGMMLVAMGLYLAGWWRGLTQLETLGGFFWRRIQPLGNRLVPVADRGKALTLGMIWGWLPCGLTYSVLLWAAAAADWRQSALLMLSFGAGTLPVMLITGRFAQQVSTYIQSTHTRRIAAILVIIFGLWTLAAAFPQHWPHQHTDMVQHPER